MNLVKEKDDLPLSLREVCSVSLWNNSKDFREVLTQVLNESITARVVKGMDARDLTLLRSMVTTEELKVL